MEESPNLTVRARHLIFQFSSLFEYQLFFVCQQEAKSPSIICFTRNDRLTHLKMYRRERVNERDVPESQHTIFVRGLPGTMTTDEIRTFTSYTSSDNYYNQLKTITIY